MKAERESTVPVEAERAVLGALLLDAGAWDRIADVVAEQDFGFDRHRCLFRAIRRLIEDRQAVDAVTVCEFLRNQGAIERAGGRDYIIELQTNTLSSANAHRYAEIVREKATLRVLAGKAQEILELCQQPGTATCAELVDQAESAILSVGARQHSTMGWLADAISQELTQLNERRRSRETIAGISTGFTDLDKLLSGFDPGDLVVLAARTSMGKTAFAMNIAEHVASTHGTVAVFSLEMPQAQLARRLLAAHGKVPMQLMRSGALRGAAMAAHQ